MTREAQLAELSKWPHVLRHVEPLNGVQVTYETPETREVASIEDANVYTSEVAGIPDTHTVVIDVDVPARLVPSSTPGHAHLYIDAPMTWTRYKALLAELCDAGVIEAGYYQASMKRGHTAVRLPWIKKETPAND